jgi:hypothetical protein
MIEKTGPATRPARVEVEFGLRFSASGGVIMAGVAGEATLRVTLSYDCGSRPVAGPPSGGPLMAAPEEASAADLPGGSSS